MPSERARLVILGTGFGAFNLVRHLGDDYDVTVVSSRNYFLFTPLLPSTTVGTIEFRSIIEPIRHARKKLRFFHAAAEGIDTQHRNITCSGIFDGRRFELGYDILVIAVGAVSNTFSIPGVMEHAHFLKDLRDASGLRRRIIQIFETANLPGVGREEADRLLRFVVCGGGPTGVEFAAELHDFLYEDLRRSYPDLVMRTSITLVEAGRQILGTFDEHLRLYTTEMFRREKIAVVTESPVVQVTDTQIVLKNGSVLPYGLLLWATGNGPTPFVRSLSMTKDARMRIVVDSYFLVKGYSEIYALGDCCAVENSALPETAQVAQQEGKYLARALTKRARGLNVEPFRYRNLGMLAYIGANRALADLEAYKGRGWMAWLFWRSTYLTRIVSMKNKLSVLVDWIKARLFGRDISQF